LRRTVEDLRSELGDRKAVVARELTKIHEEFVRGTLSELSAHFADKRPRGEITLLVAGRTVEKQELSSNPPDAGELSDSALRQEVARLISEGENKKDAVKMTASRLGIPRRRVYQLMIDSG